MPPVDKNPQAEAIATLSTMPENIQALLTAGVMIGQPSEPVIEEDLGIAYTVVPEGYKIHHLPVREVTPFRPTGTLRALNAAAFVALIDAYAQAETVIYADTGYANPAAPVAPSFTGIFNHHSKAASIGARPGWLDFRAVFSPVHTPEFMAWFKIDGTAMNQVDFAEFLEEHTPEIAAPDGALLRETVLNLHTKNDVQFSKAINLANGETQLTYVEQIETGSTGGLLSLPSKMTLAMPIFDGDDMVRIEANLRIRVGAGKAMFSVHLIRLDVLIRDRLTKIKADIADGIKVPMFDAVAPHAIQPPALPGR
jgi:uncharacterized protein YfdQ (DUF2303 family)